MSECIGSSDVVSLNIDPDPIFCGCTVCTNPYVKSALNGISDLSKDAHASFTGGVRGVDPGTYKSVLTLSDGEILEDVNGANCSSSAKIMVAVAVLLALIVIVCMVFVVLAHKGVINIPGITPAMLNTMVKWVGPVLCVASFSYLMLSLGYVMGVGCSYKDRECKAIRALGRSMLRKVAVEQKEGWGRLDKCHTDFQAEVKSTKLGVTKSAYVGVPELMRLEREVAKAEAESMELGSEYTMLLVEKRELEVRSEEYEVLLKKNQELSADNAVTRSVMVDIESRLRSNRSKK
ncbi:putative membrane protein [Candidatus Ichthyocystis hellenicum]|uniref:Putative membrane protein n=1 Tax=Candidatus Ichthyocystis hellenicum TaxID=1561003 RepID=A0A0S4M187_9BURK|nr:hypothetical protein [Candidatus Ichthyocystis hellenicum]CUT17543.1 putative membrane protein [Candidatus Ichthyocystis hellenicum]